MEADGRKEIPTGGQRDRFGNDVQYVCSTEGTHVSAHQVERKKQRKKERKKEREKENHEQIDQSGLIENVTFHHKMNIWCHWELIEMLYIDVEQQPVGNVCSEENSVKNNLQITLRA